MILFLVFLTIKFDLYSLPLLFKGALSYNKQTDKKEKQVIEMINIGNDWDTYLKEEFEKPYFQTLLTFLEAEDEAYTIYPNKKDRYNALRFTPYEKVKVVMLGQDPYHGEGQAHGLCFSVPKGIKIPPSLKNIYKEQANDLQLPIPTHGNLEAWAKQGVLMINSVFTVRASKAGSHAKHGWETFSDRIISLLDEKPEPIVFLLWGDFAQSKKALLKNPNHLVLCSSHPSPLSAYRGFLGCRHFSTCNEFLIQSNLTPIDWQID